MWDLRRATSIRT